MSKTGVISGINGPIVHVKGDPGFTMNEMVYVGHDYLVGEVIGLKDGTPSSRYMRRRPESGQASL